MVLRLNTIYKIFAYRTKPLTESDEEYFISGLLYLNKNNSQMKPARSAIQKQDSVMEVKSLKDAASYVLNKALTDFKAIVKDENNKAIEFFPKGIALIEVKVKIDVIEVSLKVAGPGSEVPGEGSIS